MSREIKVLDKGFISLEDSMADDLSVVNAARVSFAQQQSKMDERGQGLIRFLMKNRHGTPFEHNAFKFRVKAPLFVVREWQRHRIGSYNEWSGRYSKLESEFYIPEYVREQTGKPGAYSFEPVSEAVKDFTRGRIEHHVDKSFELYEELIFNGIAKEVARMVLPLNLYTQFIWTVNARSLMNFLSLRNSDHAQHEIREYAIIVEEFFRQRMPETHFSFVENGRVAP